MPSDAPASIIQPDSNAVSAAQTGSCSWSKGIACGVGDFTQLFGDVGLKSLAVPVHQMALKVDPAALGLVFALPRIWDAFSDPLMGFISDRTSNRCVRRPFVVLGALLSSLAFILVWVMPEPRTPNAQLGWFLSTVLLFYPYPTAVVSGTD